MTLRHLRIFLAICDNGNNTTRAAQALHASQPAVSLALRELEEEYRVKLFERIGRRLYPTEAGVRLREYATHIQSLLDGMEQTMRDWDDTGVLRVGCSITIGSQLMPGYVKAFYKQKPGTEILVRIDRSRQLEERLLRGELDFILIEGAAHDPNLISEEYLEDSLAAVCAPGAPYQAGQQVSLEDFLSQPLLLREHGSGTREALDSALEVQGFSAQPAWEGVSTAALVNAAAAGLGVAVVPRRMIAAPLEQGVVVDIRIAGLDLRRKLRIVYHRHKYLTSKARDFRTLCRASAFSMGSPGQ